MVATIKTQEACGCADPACCSDFKRCPCCGHVWTDREAFLADPEKELLGYQANPRDPARGFYLFGHRPCGTTLAIQVERFMDLYEGPFQVVNLYGTDKCAEYCLYEDVIEPCTEDCACTYAREIMQTIRRWPTADHPLSVTR